MTDSFQSVRAALAAARVSLHPYGAPGVIDRLQTVEHWLTPGDREYRGDRAAACAELREIGGEVLKLKRQSPSTATGRDVSKQSSEQVLVSGASYALDYIAKAMDQLIT